MESQIRYGGTDLQYQATLGYIIRSFLNIHTETQFNTYIEDKNYIYP